MPERYAYLNRRKIKFNVEVDHNKGLLRINTPFFRPLIDEIKCMDKPRDCYDPKTKTWSVYCNRRNLFALDILGNGPLISRYDKPIVVNSYEGNWAHQNEMQSAILQRKQYIIAGEMRTGKTKPTLQAIQLVKPHKPLIVTTGSGLRGIQRECLKWGIGATIITYDRMKRTVKSLQALEKTGVYIGDQIPQFVVFDECQKLKNFSSQTAVAAMDLSNYCYHTYGYDNYYMIGLSGTPAPKDPVDWWSICEIIQPGFLKEGSVSKFKQRLGEFEQQEGAVGQIYWKWVKWHDDELYKLYRRMRPLVGVFLKKYCLDLPEKQYEVVELKPSRKVLRVAKALTDQAGNALVARNVLRQLSDGFQYEYGYDETKMKKVRTGCKWVGSPKIDAFKEDLDVHSDVGRFVVFAGFSGSIDKLTETAVGEGWVVLQIDGRGYNVYYDEERVPNDLTSKDLSVDSCLSELDRSSNQDIIPRLCAVINPDSGATGLELSASPTLAYYSNTDKGASRMQSEDRAYSDNMDKQRGLLIKDYCYLPSDYLMRENLLRKKDLQSITMGDLKSLFEEMGDLDE